MFTQYVIWKKRRYSAWAIKSASFIILAIVFKYTGKYIRHQKYLLEGVNNEEKEI